MSGYTDAIIRHVRRNGGKPGYFCLPVKSYLHIMKLAGKPWIERFSFRINCWRAGVTVVTYLKDEP